MFTILRPFFDCDEIAQMGAEPGSWSTRKSTPDEIAMCRLSNQLAFYGVWTIIGLCVFDSSSYQYFNLIILGSHPIYDLFPHFVHCSGKTRS